MQIKEGVVVSLSKKNKKKTKVIAGKQNANLQSYFWCVWSAPLCILYSEVFAKSVHILGISLFCQPICIICGREGPGVEIKVHLMSSLESHECKFPNHTQQYLFDSQRKHKYFGIHVTFCSIMYQRQFALPAGNLFTKRNKSSA